MFLVLGLQLSGVACGKFGAFNDSDLIITGPAVEPFATCDRSLVPTVNICTEAIGTDYDDAAYIAIVQSSCTSTGGIFSTEVCERTTSLGSCVVAGGETNEVHVTYYSPQYDDVSARDACENQAGGIYTDN